MIAHISLLNCWDENNIVCVGLCVIMKDVVCAGQNETRGDCKGCAVGDVGQFALVVPKRADDSDAVIKLFHSSSFYIYA